MTAKSDRVDSERLLILKEVLLPIVLTIISAISTVAATYAAYRTQMTGEKVQQVHEMVNSRMTEMLKIVKSASHKEGMLDERGLGTGKIGGDESKVNEDASAQSEKEIAQVVEGMADEALLKGDKSGKEISGFHDSNERKMKDK